MSDAAKIAAALERLPAELRELVRAEVAAGNAIVGVVSVSADVPQSVCVQLAARVTTRPRASTGAVRFIEQHSERCGGAFADHWHMQVVVEPPRSASIEADMEGIRAALRERERASDEERMRELYW